LDIGLAGRLRMGNIPISYNILIVLLFIFFGFLEARRLFSKYPGLNLNTILKKAPYLYAIIPIIFPLAAANLILQNRQYFLWNMPLWLQYSYSAIIWGGILAIFSFIFSLASAIAFRTKHHEKWKVVISGVLLIAAVQYVQWMYTRPLAPQLGESISSDGIFLQSSGSSCVAASAANILQTFGIKKTEKEMAELFGTNLIRGTSVAQIVYGLRKISFSGKKKFIKDSDLTKLKAPAIIFLNDEDGGIPHAVAYMGSIDKKAEIWDPAGGKAFWTEDKIKKHWHGRAIEIRKLKI